MADLIDRLARPLRAVLTDRHWYVPGVGEADGYHRGQLVFAVWFGFLSGAPSTDWREDSAFGRSMPCKLQLA